MLHITYMDSQSPLNPNNAQRVAYYRAFPKLVKDQQVPCRRIDRASVANMEWIEKVLKEFQNSDFSYGVWVDDDLDRPDIEAVSVSIIDGHFTFLVAVGAQQGGGAYRDVEVDSPEFSQIWTRYHERLWSSSRCLKLMTRGKPVKSEIDRLRNLVRSHKKK